MVEAVDTYFKTLGTQQSRLQFKIDSKMCPTVAANFHRDPKFKAIKYMCVGCSVGKSKEPTIKHLDSESHILKCKAYEDLRENLDLESQRDILSYFQAVIDRRTSEDN